MLVVVLCNAVAFEGIFTCFFLEIFFFLQILVFFFVTSELDRRYPLNKKEFINFYTLLFCLLGGLSFLLFLVVDPRAFYSIFYVDAIKSGVSFWVFKAFIFFSAAIILQVCKQNLNQSIGCLKFCNFLSCISFLLLLLLQAFKVVEMIFIIEFISFMLYFLLSAERFERFEVIEAGVKYYCLGGLAVGLIFLWVIVLFFISGKNLDLLSLREIVFLNSADSRFLYQYSFALFSISVFFKLSIFPNHIWTPEVYDGSSGGVVLVYTLLVKFGFLIFFFKICVYAYLPILKDFEIVFYVCALSSLIFGAVGASIQTRIFRLLGYSSISFMGGCLTLFFCETYFAIAANFLYYIIYVLGFLGFVGCLQQMHFRQVSGSRVFAQFVLLNRVSFGWGLFACFFFFSLAGIPPFPGFFAKLPLLFALGLSQHYLFFIIMSFCNVLGYFYGLRILKYVLFSKAEAFGKVQLFLVGESNGIYFYAFWLVVLGGVGSFYIYQIMSLCLLSFLQCM